MSGLYVKLDAEYASDDKLIEAGPLAELLYIRGLCFCKRTMSDGKIKRSQLAAVALGIPSATKHAHALVTVGAWRATQGGWVIASWLKRNKSAEQIKADIEAKRLKSLHGNHQRWHIQEGKYDPSCEWCNPPVADPSDDPPGDPQLFAGDSTEPEEEPKPEPQPKEEPRKSSSVLTVVPDHPGDDDDDLFERTVQLVLETIELQWAGRITKPRSWRHAVRKDIITTDGALIRRMLTSDPPEQVALFVLGHGQSTAETRAEQPQCPTTCECAGEGYIGTTDERGVHRLAPCPGRTA